MRPSLRRVHLEESSGRLTNPVTEQEHELGLSDVSTAREQVLLQSVDFRLVG